jgi:uncharacterized membrane protein YeaQ/YmgE (transglycosylase-associated protein family)
MQIIALLVVGLIVGVVARIVMLVIPGRDPPGMLVTILVGVGGSLLAGMLGWSMGGEVPLVASVFGAMILLTLYRLVTYHRVARIA